MADQPSPKPAKKQIPPGAVITSPGNSILNKTGSWGTQRPKTDLTKCTHCMMCWVYCPDDCIPVKDKKRGETNFDYCKGCGICLKVCPFKAIEMVDKKR